MVEETEVIEEAIEAEATDGLMEEAEVMDATEATDGMEEAEVMDATEATDMVEEAEANGRHRSHRWDGRGLKSWMPPKPPTAWKRLKSWDAT